MALVDHGVELTKNITEGVGEGLVDVLGGKALNRRGPVGAQERDAVFFDRAFQDEHVDEGRQRERPTECLVVSVARVDIDDR